MLVAAQLFVAGLYRPPVFTSILPSYPPQAIISLPVHTPVGRTRAEGELVVLMAVQLLVVGLYLPPALRWLPLEPPQTIISLPVQTAV